MLNSSEFTYTCHAILTKVEDTMRFVKEMKFFNIYWLDLINVCSFIGDGKKLCCNFEYIFYSDLFVFKIIDHIIFAFHICVCPASSLV